MSTIKKLVEQVLPHRSPSCAVLLSTTSTAEFLLNFEKIKAKSSDALSEQEFLLLRNAAIKFHEPKTSTLRDFELSSSLVPLKTNSKTLDRSLSGGFFPGEVFEITGSAGSGKTQLALHTTAHCLLNKNGGVIYINSSGDFTATRLMDLLSMKKELPETVMTKMLRRVRAIPLHDIYSLINLLHQISEVNQSADTEGEFIRTVSLIVIDSITLLLGSAVGSKLADTSTLFSSVGRELRKVAYQLQITILVINNTVTADTPGQVKPALGFYWREQCHRRLTVLDYDQSNSDLFKFRLDT